MYALHGQAHDQSPVSMAVVASFFLEAPASRTPPSSVILGAEQINRTRAGAARRDSREEDEEAACRLQLYAKLILTAQLRSNGCKRPRGGRYFIYRPGWTVKKIPSASFSGRLAPLTAATQS